VVPISDLFKWKMLFSATRFTIEKIEVSREEILSGFEFVQGLFGIVLWGGYLYVAWLRTVLILVQFKFIIPEL